MSQSLNETERQLEIMKAANAAKKVADMQRKVEKEEARLRGRFAATAKVILVSVCGAEQSGAPMPLNIRSNLGGFAVHPAQWSNVLQL